MVEIPIPTLAPHNSLNRVQIVDLPGLPIDHAVRGQRVVARHARARAEALKLPAALAQDSLETRLELPRFVDDGSAVHAQAAVILAGTGLGINFPPMLARDLRPLVPIIFQGD